MKFSTSILLANFITTTSALNSGSLDQEVKQVAAESSVQAIVTTAQRIIVEKTTTEAIIENTQDTKSLVVDSVVAATSVITAKNSQGYAVEPATTVITTDAKGNKVTQALWWVASVVNTASTSKKVKTYATAIDSSIVESNEADKSSSTSTKIWWTPSTTTSDSTKKDSASDSTTTNWDEALATVTTTNSDGVLYTSKVWWLPTSSSNTFNESGAKYSTSYSVFTTTYTTKLASTLETITTTLSTAVIKKVDSATYTSSTSSTNSISKNSTNGAGKIEYGMGVGAVALAALLF